MLYTCLFASKGHDLRAVLREGASHQEFVEHITSIWKGRSDRYSELRSNETHGRQRVEMSYIGG